MTTLNSKLRLQLLANKKLQRRSGKGFTLIELMVTVATLGTLAAVAFPAFSNAQNRAEAGAVIGSMQGFAKECAVKAITGDSSTLTDAAGVDVGNGGDCSGGTTISNATAFVAGSIGGLQCGEASGSAVSANGNSHTKCTLTVGSDGTIAGAWSDS